MAEDHVDNQLWAELGEVDCLSHSWQRGGGRLPGAADRYNMEQSVNDH